MSIVFSDDEYIRKLNKKFRHIDAPTDVLSFPQNEGDFSFVHPRILGDIVISAEWASREAERGRDTPDKEIDFLLIHGILHLLGFDHEKSKEGRVRMEKREEEISELLQAEATP